MKDKEYSELLEDPRWQKKRLEVMQRDNFTCQMCGCTNKPLHVHHTYYEKGKKPWEYPNKNLVTLCKDCHQFEHNINIFNYINIARECGLLSIELLALIDIACIKMFGGGDFSVIINNAVKDKSIEKVIRALKFGKFPIIDICKNLSDWHKIVDELE